MKKALFTKIGLSIAFLAMFSVVAIAQDEKASPAQTAEGEINGAEITVNYSSPAVKGRTIWGDLVPFGQVWRAGADDATTFETSEDIKIQGQDLPAGTYSFFIIPGETESTFIFNKVAKQWGAYKYEESEDVLRVNVPSEESQSFEERLVYEVKPDGLEIRWENGKAFAKIE